MGGEDRPSQLKDWIWHWEKRVWDTSRESIKGWNQFWRGNKG